MPTSRLRRAIERFLAVEAASSIALLVVTALALALANGPLQGWWAHVLHVTHAHFAVNDVLMTIFFFVVGLEIRREIDRGELAELRRAALPLATALGGMIVPALLFLTLNVGRSSARGWGTPMATDIAFAVGVLDLMGKRVPPALRVLLLALAVIDDVGAIVVIAVFYASTLSGVGFAVAAVAIAIVLVMRRAGVRRPLFYVAPGVLLWWGILRAGIHPTLAGVALGLLTPARPSEGESEAPVDRLQHLLHRWVAFGVMPIFALVNAGVSVTGARLGGDAGAAFAGVLGGLALGKPLGVVVFGLVAVKLGFAAFPRGLGARHLVVLGFAAGIGFTMATFIGQLAFADPALLSAAKLAILGGSALAAVATVLGARFLLPSAIDRDAALTESEAEASTDT